MLAVVSTVVFDWTGRTVIP